MEYKKDKKADLLTDRILLFKISYIFKIRKNS